MLQNRVDPEGAFIKTSARGSFMGNRGVIHNAHKEITHPFKHKAWIICELEFKARKRTVMTPNRWTELFFLDEATAFAAGHRPCFECRREAANRFKACWINGNPAYGFTMKTSINAIDEVLHRERIDAGGKVTHQQNATEVPEGAFVLVDGKPHIIHLDRLFLWTPFGYGQSQVLPRVGMLTVLTPRSVANAFLAGYTPRMSETLTDKFHG